MLTRALEAHLRVRPVQHAGLKALACLAKVARSQVFDVGGIPIVLGSMSKFKRDPEVQVSGAMVLGAVCLSSSLHQRSVAKYGGIQVLAEALVRHTGRADVLIAVSETLVIIGQGAGLRKQLQSILPEVESIVDQYEAAKASAEKQGSAQRRDCEVVLKSLQKLEAYLGSRSGAARRGEAPSDDDPDAGAPQYDPCQEAVVVEQAAVNYSSELQERMEKWGERKARRTSARTKRPKRNGAQASTKRGRRERHSERESVGRGGPLADPTEG